MIYKGTAVDRSCFNPRVESLLNESIEALNPHQKRRVYGDEIPMADCKKKLFIKLRARRQYAEG